MKKRTVISRAVKLGSLILAIVLCVLLLQEFVLARSDHNRVRIKGFYLEKPRSLDVVFIGSSEIYSGFSSVYAYERYGFTSYPYAAQACAVQCYKTMLKEVLRTQDPKLIVIEINGALYGENSLRETDHIRSYADNIPLNPNKLELVRSVATDDEAEYIMPIIKYHGTWEDPSQGFTWNCGLLGDIFRGSSVLKGVKTKTEIYKPEDKVFPETAITQRMPLEKSCEDSLRELLDYCRDNGIDNVIFTRFPHIVTKHNYRRTERSNTVADIIAGYGYDFVPFDTCNENIGLDVGHDFYNIEHLNIYGMTKNTEYVARYLAENYGVTPSKLSDSAKADWDEAVKYYRAYRDYVYELFEQGTVDEISESWHHMIEIKKRLDRE